MKIDKVVNYVAQLQSQEISASIATKQAFEILAQVPIPKEVEDKFTENGRLKEMSYKDYMSLSFPVMFNLMNKYAVYVAPTTELLDYLDNLIDDNSCIEICAGMGYIGKGLNIEHITDSYVQVCNKEVRERLLERGGVITTPPPFVEKLEAVKAVEKYRPHTVLVCFGTHKSYVGGGSDFGVDFKKLKKFCRRIIFVGNAKTHRENPILRMAQTFEQPEGLVTRCVNPELNLVAIWER